MAAPRFELSGPMAPSGPPGPGNPSNPPVLIFTYNANDTFNPLPYLDQGYTRFDAIAIGGGGGGGGGIDYGSYNSTGSNKCPGGAGGGGGVQYVKRGLLSILPVSCPIVIGAGGAPGVSQQTNAALTTDGGDGGTSSFNGSSCRASGGKGGKAFTGNLAVVTPGGDGGLGGSNVAGGGGSGATSAPGTWNPSTGIGSGGGGGAGGIGSYRAPGAGGGITAAPNATNGGGGAFNASDLSFYSPGSTAGQAVGQLSNQGLLIPGYAGGAKASIITGLSTTYGDSQVRPDTAIAVAPLAGKAGVVILRLTAD